MPILKCRAQLFDKADMSRSVKGDILAWFSYIAIHNGRLGGVVVRVWYL